MGTVLLEIGVKIRKGLIFTIRCCLRSVYNHPFLVGFLCFLMFIYRSSPFVFSLLVSASPVLICTAVLLGMLLSYGEPNIPELEIEERKVKFETNGSHFLQMFGEKAEEGFDDTAPLIEERSREIKSNNGEIWEEKEGENRELIDLKMKTEWIDEKIIDEDLESDGEKSESDSFDSEKVNVASLDSLPRSPWILIEEEDKLDGEENSGSDLAESSSPDASMTDIMPILDELNPLLDEEISPLQPVSGSQSGSDVLSESSSESNDDSNPDDLEDDQDYVDDNEGEDDAQRDKEEQKKSAITWTEEDQKNLMDLGSSEIERNQRLENLILKRRSRNNMSTVHERNLIDLENDDYQFDLAPISTRRQNPFDDDSYDDNLGLPLIPGSAPSVMLQRENPFGIIPYDSNEEKLDLMGDEFKEEFAVPQLREAVFRRQWSFNIVTSDFAPGVKGVRMRPYPVSEGVVLDESSYSSFSFPHQSSEISESKVSYVPDDKSTGLVEDLDDPQLASNQEEDEEDDIDVGHGSQSSEDEDTPEVVRAELEIDIPQRAPVYDLSPRHNESRVAPEISTTHPTEVVDVREHDNLNMDFSEIEFEPQVQRELNFHHLDEVQTAEEQVDNIKEIDEDILAELDKVGDFSVQQWETGSIGFEKTIDSIEENEIDNMVHSEKWREDIDIQEEGVECVSEPQLSEASGPEHIEVSRMEFDEKEGPDSPDSKTSEKIEAQSDPTPPEENEITHTETAYGMPEFEAGKIVDIDLAFKQITAKDMTVDSEPTVEKSEHLNSSVVGFTDKVPVQEVGTIESELNLDSNESLSDSVDRALCVIESEEILETFSDQASCENKTLSNENEGLAYESIVSFSYDSELAENEVKYQDRVDIEMAYGMTEVEVSKVEDIDLKFKEIAAKETVVKPNLVEHSKNESSRVAGFTLGTLVPEVLPIKDDTSLGSTPLPDSVDRALHVIGSEETQSKLVENDVTYQGQVDMEADYGMTELEASNVEDIDLAFKQITSKNDYSTVTTEVIPIEEDTFLGSTQPLLDSVDQALHASESEETQGIYSGSDVEGKGVPSVEVTLPPNDSVLELLNSNSDDESVEVKADEVSVESIVQEISVAGEKPDNEVEVPKDSKKPSSSSSSSSSDSDKE